MKVEPEPRQRVMDELRELADALGPALIPPERVATMAPAVEWLGAGLPEFALESHFGQQCPAVDLTLRLKPGGRDALLANSPARADKVWDLLCDWAAPHDPLFASPFLEFEFDLETHPTEPWIGPCVEPLLRAGPRAIQARRDRETKGRPTLTPLLLAATERLGPPEGLSPATRERIRACVLHLPRWGLLGQLARLDGRPSNPREGIRVFVSLPRASFHEYFTALGAGPAVPGWQARIEQFAPHESWIDLDFGIHHGEVEPVIGFYREYRGPRWSNSQLRWILAQLRDDGSCTDAAAESIRSWVQSVDGCADREITFKLAFGPEGPHRAKVYFSVLRHGYGCAPTQS